MTESMGRGTPPGMTEADVTLRSEVGRFLGKECWPADRERLLEVASSNHATDEVLSVLRRAPQGQHFQNLAEVWESVGGHNESRRT